ncbi:hypothetical protein [Paenibacillus harenae]|uniref:Uncharacterized membrane protein YkvA (DUF1232 family) n=1 Tax=Paenibacillus harenae TaxID=306543 RepID=A0ABT9TWV3_PAEHA|nr:hypothetical protein [Paenibacillus harenae]MDQ0058471.1 uncharacterized membrane protein YkvA (DUF1232 family) [Paenibacillus harenae]MDQ0111813.1 uncharacterized membrane protein YkvA (DUF1232 family) [Paenibacillus harenae]
MRKLLSLRHWKQTFGLIFKLLRSREVEVKDKLIFGVPVFLYWILPDVLPMMPIDDIAVTMFVAEWFARRMQTKYNMK